MEINEVIDNRAAITEFNGLKIRNNAGNNDFIDMSNIDGHEYPYFSTRRKNCLINNGTYGMTGNQSGVEDNLRGVVAYDTDLYYMILRGNNLQVEKITKTGGNPTVLINNATLISKSAYYPTVTASVFKERNRQMIVMGVNIIIYPDWIKYNIKDNKTISLSKEFSIDYSSIETNAALIYMSTEDGGQYGNTEYPLSTSSTTGKFSNGSAKTWVKSSPDDRYYFEFKQDGNQKIGTVYRYYSASSMWMPVDEYCTISIPVDVIAGCSSISDFDDLMKEMEFKYNIDLDTTLNLSGISSIAGGKLNGEVLLHRIIKSGDTANRIKFVLKGINIWNYTFTCDGSTYEAMVYKATQNNLFYLGETLEPLWKDILKDFDLKNNLYNSFDFIVQEGNRLFACSSQNHEILACKLGDPSLWKEFKGISTDSYAATVGTPGDFTGAAVFNNTPIFFKENCIHRVTGNTPSSFNISYDYYDGVASGNYKSIARVGNYLIYYSKGGFVYYTGNQPERIDKLLGNKRFRNVVAGEKEGHYIAEVIDKSDNKTYILDYDMDLNQWYKFESKPRNVHQLVRMINISNDLYLFFRDKYADYTEENELLHTTIENIGRNLNDAQTQTIESDFNWYAESGWLVKEATNKNYITRMLFKMHLDPDAEISISFKYDYNAEWEEVRTISNTDDYPKTEIISIIPKRCETMRYKVEGKGKVIIYSITYDISEGSEY